MKRPVFCSSFALRAASIIVFIGSIVSFSKAQMSHVQQMENDSLNLMIQQWHSLPEASVQTIGLAAGAKGVDEVPRGIACHKSRRVGAVFVPRSSAGFAHSEWSEYPRGGRLWSAAEHWNARFRHRAQCPHHHHGRWHSHGSSSLFGSSRLFLSKHRSECSR